MDGEAVAVVGARDFTHPAGSLAFAPGETQRTVRLEITDDGAAEGFESFGLRLAEPVGATLLRASALSTAGTGGVTSGV